MKIIGCYFRQDDKGLILCIKKMAEKSDNNSFVIPHRNNLSSCLNLPPKLVIWHGLVLYNYEILAPVGLFFVPNLGAKQTLRALLERTAR